MMTMIKGELDGIPVQLDVEETIFGLGGYPIFRIGQYPMDSYMIADVDTLDVYKAIATSSTVKEFCERVTLTWSSTKLRSAAKLKKAEMELKG